MINQDKFRILFEQSSGPHLIFSDDGITDCNDATIKLLNTSCKKDVLKLHPSELSPTVQPDGRLSKEKGAELETVVQKVESWCRPGVLDDDVTILACELN